MYADWHVLRFDNGPALITSDVGYTITARSGDWGYTVPLNKEIAVAVYPCRRRELKGLAFFASNESEALNEAVAANAVSESYCSHAELAATALRAMEAIPASKHAVGPGLFGFEPEELRRMEMDWIEIGDSIHPWSEEPRCEDIAVAVRVTRVGYVIADLPWALRVSRETRV